MAPTALRPLQTIFKIVSSLGLCLASLTQHKPCHAADIPSLLDISISELALLLESGELTSRALTQLYVDRIHDVNDDLHAVIEINPDAIAIASDLDRQRAAGHASGPLFGIPILVKDNYATHDRMLTGAGSVCLAPVPATLEATVVTRLRQAGAIILGKANADEFSGSRGFNVTGGWSARGGQTYGAYVEKQTPCGSSSGSGVAASLGLAAAALGTETAGSITCPAAYNNVVGIKPSVGTTSRHGVVPVTLRQDTTGPLAQSIADAALLLDVMAGVDPLDNYTSAQPWDSPPSFTAALNLSALQGKRLGMVRVASSQLALLDGVNKNETEAVLNATRRHLEVAGAEVVDVALFPDPESALTLIEWVFGNMSVYGLPDFRDGLGAYIDTIPAGAGTVHDLETLVECVKSDPRELASVYSYDSLTQTLDNDTLPAGSSEVWEAYLTASGATRGLVAGLLEQHQVDALVLVSDLAYLLGASAGLPIVTVPMGALGEDAQTARDPTNTTVQTAPGMPLGLSFMADKWSDVELVSYGYAYEQVSRKREQLKPYLKPRHDLDSVLRPRAVDARQL